MENNEQIIEEKQEESKVEIEPLFEEEVAFTIHIR